ncbi:MAG: ABC transporter permease [Proteobacteria bacterium]|nr:ABC transporter permease [Pseudomonadota bacterium]
MRRSGSPWTGMGVVIAKELADHLGSARMLLLEGLVFLTGLGAVTTSIQTIRANIGQDPFLFLKLLTVSREPLPSFVLLLGFLTPLMAIALGFDSVNGEFNRRTMSRVLAQPIYRDALLLGKFLAGLGTLSVGLISLWLLVIGLGLITLGLPPNTEEVVRMVAFLFTTIAYGGVWLALAMLFSVRFASPATAALGSLSVWLLFAVFWSILTPLASDIIAGPPGDMLFPNLENIELNLSLARLSPNTLYAETTLAILHPTTRTLGPVLFNQVQGALLGAPLPVGQSILLIWPQLTGLVSATLILFTATYVVFQRQEIRA